MTEEKTGVKIRGTWAVSSPKSPKTGVKWVIYFQMWGLERWGTQKQPSIVKRKLQIQLQQKQKGLRI